MLTLGLITQQQYDEAKADDVYSRITEVNETTKSKDIIYTWFEDAAIDQVLNDLQEKLGYTSAEANNALYSGGLQIYLTQSVIFRILSTAIIMMMTTSHPQSTDSTGL